MLIVMHVRAKSLQLCLSLCIWTVAEKSTRLLCPWDSPDKNTGVGCHALIQGTFSTQGSNPGLLHWQADSLPLSHLGSLKNYAQREINISWHIHVILVVRLNMGKLG